MKTKVIYKITNQINQKVYIGQTNNPRVRWSKHKSSALNAPTQTIHSAMKKYGIENFTFEVICSILPVTDETEYCKIADEFEEQFITEYQSHISFGKGYNVSAGGSTSPKTEEWKESVKQAKLLNGTWSRVGEDNPLFGIPRPKEVIEKIRETKITNNTLSITGEDNPLFGIPRSSETIEKIKDAKAANPFTPTEEHIEKLQDGLKKYLDETGKTSVAQGFKHSDETKAIWSQQRKGKHFSPDTEFKPGQKPEYSPFMEPDFVPWNKGKSTPIKLTLEQIAEIKIDCRSTRELAKIYGVGKSTIQYHKRRI